MTLELKGDADMAWPPEPAAAPGAISATRRVWLIAATIGAETREVAIDKETFRFLREIAGDTTRVYWDFAPFDGALMPTRILEIAKTRQGETRTPFTWKTVVHDAPVEDWRFSEDMPAKPVR